MSTESRASSDSKSPSSERQAKQATSVERGGFRPFFILDDVACDKFFAKWVLKNMLTPPAQLFYVLRHHFCKLHIA
jgi:hypothetical protein